jgi:hypothetical protein
MSHILLILLPLCLPLRCGDQLILYEEDAAPYAQLYPQIIRAIILLPFQLRTLDYHPRQLDLLFSKLYLILVTTRSYIYKQNIK